VNVTGRLKQAYIASRVAHDHPQAQSKFVNVENVNLHFVIRGSGRPVVLIHGNPGSSQDWTRLYEPIAARYQATSFDRPGHGHSDRPNYGEDVTVEVQARLLCAALDELRVERPILVGHSWGGALALAYALLHPRDLSGLVLLAPAVYESEDGVSFLSKLPAWPIIGDVVNFLFTPLIGAYLVRTDLQKAFAPDPIPKHYLRHVLSEWTRPRKVKWYSVDDALLNESLPELSSRYSELIDTNPRESGQRNSGDGNSESFDSINNGSRLRVPVSILVGDSDQIVPLEENSRRLHQALPGSELIVLPNTGHQIPFTRPDSVVEAIDQVAAKTRVFSR
jgi:pimeloyl-ACP methyl ester carboxylesterase